MSNAGWSSLAPAPPCGIETPSLPIHDTITELLVE